MSEGMVSRDVPERIWIEQDDCPYFYEESELAEVGSPVTEYIRADLCHRPAPAATDTGLEAAMTVHVEDAGDAGIIAQVDDLITEERGLLELVTRSQAEDIIRDLETKILEAAISDRLDDAGSPLSWQERAEIAEGIISDLKADNAAERAEKERAKDDLTRALVHFVREHFPENTTFKPLDDLIGLITQFDNASTIAREYVSRIRSLEAKLAAAEKELEIYKSTVKGVCESQRGTKWGKAAECIFDAIERAKEANHAE